MKEGLENTCLPLLPGWGCNRLMGEGECRADVREAEPGGGGDLRPRSSWTRRLRSWCTRLRHRCFSRSFHPDDDDEEDDEDADEVEDVPEVCAAAAVGEKKASAAALGPGRVGPPPLLSI